MAEAGRLPRDGVGLVTALLPFVVFGAGIAVSARLPVTSLTLIGGGLVLQLVVDGTRFTATSWPAYLLLLYPIVNVSARARPAVAWSSLPLAAVYAVAAGLLLTLPGWSPDGWPVFSTRVALDWRGAGLALLVTTTGADADGPVPAGRGIGNMTERARLAGGWLTASADEEGAFIVNAFIPAPADETREAA